MRPFFKVGRNPPFLKGAGGGLLQARGTLPVRVAYAAGDLRLMTIEEIISFLPHRYPMLLVDRIMEIDHEKRTCKGLKNVTINEPFFQGHYPGRPIMPGVLIIEAMAQVGAALLLTSEFEGRIPLIGAIDDVKFKRPVVPGDQLIIDVEILWVRTTAGVGRMKGLASVDGEMAAQMEMTFKLRERDA